MSSINLSLRDGNLPNYISTLSPDKFAAMDIN